MSSAQVRELLEELAASLDRAGLSAGIRVVGGAAISLLDESRRATADIDAVILPGGVADQIVEEMTIKYLLPPDWINQAALAYVPPVGLEDWVEVMSQGRVTVSIGSVRMLLAMKLRANRGIESIDDAQEIYEHYHAQDVLTNSARERVQYWLDNHESQ
jgi:hypothetical protein